METINFRDFMNESYKKERKITVPTLSLTGVSIPSLLNFPPMVTKAYAIVFVVGVIAITFAVFEDRFANVGMFTWASSIMGFLKTVLPFVFYGALIWFVLNNPLL